jgi:hypothetical protein
MPRGNFKDPETLKKAMETRRRKTATRQALRRLDVPEMNPDTMPGVDLDAKDRALAKRVFMTWYIAWLKENLPTMGDAMRRIIEHGSSKDDGPRISLINRNLAILDSLREGPKDGSGSTPVNIIVQGHIKALEGKTIEISPEKEEAAT